MFRHGSLYVTHIHTPPPPSRLKVWGLNVSFQTPESHDMQVALRARQVS